MLNFADYGKPVPEKDSNDGFSRVMVQVYHVGELSKNDKTERPIIFFIHLILTTYEKVIHYGNGRLPNNGMREGNHE